MLIFALDDEPLLLRRLCRTISDVVPDAEVRAFTRVSAALSVMEEENLRPDIVFLDIEMPGMSGMELAEKLASIDAECKIVFCTSYAQYAVEAIGLHISGHLGYLIKPITADNVKKELEYIFNAQDKHARLEAKCFGSFEVYAGGELLAFKRSRTKELLAFRPVLSKEYHEVKSKTRSSYASHRRIHSQSEASRKAVQAFRWRRTLYSCRPDRKQALANVVPLRRKGQTTQFW